MTTRVGALAMVAAGLLLAGGLWLVSGPGVVEVPPGRPVEAVLSSVSQGTVVRLLSGVHGPFEVGRRVTVEAAPGAEVRGPITVTADGVRLRGLVVLGGESGIVVTEADGVVLDRVVVRGARLHGIEVAPGSATLRDCRIEGLVSPYAQGFEVRNSNGRPRTVVSGCTVSSGQEGLVAHVSRVEFRNNVVSGTTLRAIVVTEMSEGVAHGNVVHDIQGIGLYCGDESHCEFRDNVVRRVAANPSAGPDYRGYGAAAVYHATMRVQGNGFEQVAAREPIRLSLFSRLTEEFPLSIWPPGWRGAVPGLWVAGASLLGLWLVRRLMPPVVRRLNARRGPSRGAEGSGRLEPVLVVGFGVQSFHMLEHVVQVFQVYVAEAETRSGVLGSVVDTEWVHFLYNGATLLFVVAAAWLLWSGRVRWSPSVTVGSYLTAAVVIQGYHMAEHAAKLAQHLAFKVNPAPGLLGGDIGLVWFHFGINLAVYTGMAVALVPVAVRWGSSLAGRLRADESLSVEVSPV